MKPEMIKHNKLPALWFFFGFGIFMFSRASRVIPFIIISRGLAMIIAPVFILAFIRSQPTKRGILLTFLGFLLSFNIALWGLFDAGNEFPQMLFSIVRSSVLAILFSFSYAMDKIVYPKFNEKGFISVFTFPIITTSAYFLISLEGPFDGDAIFAVFGYGHHYFRQMASLAGLWGFVFVFSWFASVMNYNWEQKFHWEKTKKVTLPFLSVLLVILLFGAVKTSSLIRPESETVKIASIILLPEKGRTTDTAGLFSRESSRLKEALYQIEKLAEKASLHYAKIVTFQEMAIKIREDDELKLMNRLQEIAREQDIYLSLSYGVYPEEEKGWNKHVLVNNRGERKIEYCKRYLLGLGDLFGETILYKKGPEVIQTTDSPYGRIGISICRDMSFPRYIRQAGKKNVDIMLSSAYDFPKSTSHLYALRAVENGFSFIRPTYNGISFAVDYTGKILAEMDSDSTEDGIMYAGGSDSWRHNPLFADWRSDGMALCGRRRRHFHL